MVHVKGARWWRLKKNGGRLEGHVKGERKERGERESKES